MLAVVDNFKLLSESKTVGLAKKAHINKIIYYTIFYQKRL